MESATLAATSEPRFKITGNVRLYRRSARFVLWRGKILWHRRRPSLALGGHHDCTDCRGRRRTELCRGSSRRRADLSRSPDHHDRAAGARRLDRHAGPPHGQGHERDIGPDRDRGKRQRRRRHHRRHPRRALGARRLYGAVGHVGHQRRRRRHLQSRLRLSHRFRAGGARRDAAVPDRRAQNHAGEQSEGIGRLDQSQSRQGDHGHVGRRLAEPRRRRADGELDRREMADGVVSQRRPCHPGSARRHSPTSSSTRRRCRCRT